jgi:Uma2 family endonuclease
MLQLVRVSLLCDNKATAPTEEVGMTAMYIADPDLVERLRAEREAKGDNLRDEVWEGVYFMVPIADLAHQRLAVRFAVALENAFGPNNQNQTYAGVNVSDRKEGWKQNFRIPDLAVVLPGSRARDCGTHLCGGPDFVVEILSAGDRALEKLPFYAGIGVRELLIIDRDPWEIELYRLEGKQLVFQGRSSLGQPTLLESSVLPLSFRLVTGEPQPIIEVCHSDGVRCWPISPTSL